MLVTESGSFQTGLLAYLILDWRNLHFATGGFILPQIFLWAFVEESLRWMFTKRKWRRVLSFSLRNDQQRHKVISKSSQTGFKPVYPVRWWDMVKDSGLRCPTVLLVIVWSVVGFTDSGLGISISGSDFSDDFFVKSFSGTGSTSLGLIFFAIFGNCLGRRTTLIVG